MMVYWTYLVYDSRIPVQFVDDGMLLLHCLLDAFKRQGKSHHVPLPCFGTMSDNETCSLYCAHLV
jgi:hypothetical protein